MPFTGERRQAYKQHTGLTDETIDQAIGSITLDEVSARESGLSDAEIQRARSEIREVLADTLIIGAKYNKAARRTGRKVAQEIAAAEHQADRTLLHEIIADEYQFMNPVGDSAGKETTIDGIMHGRVLFEDFGRGGYETVENSLQIHGGTAVYIHTIRVDSHAQAKKVDTGEVYEHDLSGTYRNTNTFVYRNGRWQISAGQMTHVPDEPKFNLVGHE